MSWTLHCWFCILCNDWSTMFSSFLPAMMVLVRESAAPLTMALLFFHSTTIPHEPVVRLSVNSSRSLTSATKQIDVMSKTRVSVALPCTEVLRASLSLKMLMRTWMMLTTVAWRRHLYDKWNIRRATAICFHILPRTPEHRSSHFHKFIILCLL